MDAFSGRPNFPKSASIFAGLGQEKIHVPQNPGQQMPESPVSRKRTVRDAGIDHGNPGAAGMGKSQEVWPKLGFRDNHQPRLQQAQIWPNRKSEVEREVENIVRAEASSRQLLTGVSRSRNDNSMLGKSFREFRC
jgi:hypothetical protein